MLKKKPLRLKSRKPDQISVFKAAEDTTLLPFLQQVLAPRSRTEIKALMTHDHVALNGRPISYYNEAISKGEEITINFSRPYYTLKNPMLRIMFEDEYLVVVEKKSGLLSVAAGNNRERNAYTVLLNYLRLRDERAKLYIVHRLDQYTSGILIFAKTIQVQDMLRSSWSNYVIDRRYLAVTENVPANPEGEIRSYLKENSAMKVYSTPNPEEGKLAVTRYKVLKENGQYAQVDVQILTGRKNQIRVHLSEMGCPVAGDRKYGAVSNPCGRLLLHNYQLQFFHPITHENKTFELPIPSCFGV